MRVRSRVFDPGARRRRSLRKSRRRVDDDRREYDAKPTAGKTAPGKPRDEAKKKKDNAPAPAPGTKAATPCSRRHHAAPREPKDDAARVQGAPPKALLAGSSAARHFRAAAKIAGRLARENARLRGRMDETQDGDARSAALVARLRGGMSNPSKTWLKSIKNTRDTRKRSRVTVYPAASPHGASVPLGGRRARSNWTPKSWSAPPAEFLSACAASSRAS